MTPLLVASFEDVAQLRAELLELRERVDFLEEVNRHFEWLSRKEAMVYLGCSSTKLWTLSKEGVIARSANRYSYKSCRDYLMSRSFSREIVQQRVQAILKLKACKIP